MCKLLPETSPETPYVALMLQTLAQARAQHYTESAPLQIVIWLAYRVLDINTRSAYAYTVLAYLFCLLEENKRGMRILKHFKQLHQQRTFPKDHPVELLLHTLQSQSVDHTSAAITSVESSLPTLSESLAMLDQTSLPAFQAQMERGMPAINRLLWLNSQEKDEGHDPA